MLISTITQSRIEAMRRGVPVIIARNDTSNCSASLTAGTEWNCGWTVYADTNDNQAQDIGEITLKTISEPKGAGITHAGPSDSRLRITRWGQPGNVGERFVVYPYDDSIGHASTTTICINAGGRIRRLTGTPVCTVN